MDKTDRLRDYGLRFLLYEQSLGICGYELIRELFIFIKLILNSYLVMEAAYYNLLYDVLKGYDHCTPSKIVSLRNNQIFVFRDE